MACFKVCSPNKVCSLCAFLSTPPKNAKKIMPVLQAITVEVLLYGGFCEHGINKNHIDTILIVNNN